MPEQISIPVGARYGRLVVLGEGPPPVHPSRSSRSVWVCQCDCGTVTTVTARYLRVRRFPSCDCWEAELAAYGAEDSIWQSMRARCRNPNNPSYHRYGGRGITVCERWESFALFLADMGPRPSPEHSLDRIDNDGPYSPENCRWATRTTQNRNTRRNHRLTHDGRTLAIVEWAELLGLHAVTIHLRLKRGWSVERTLSTPITPAGTGTPGSSC